MALTFDSLAASTLELVRPRIADNVFLANPATFWFLANGRVKTEDGGTTIGENLEHAKNDTVQSYTGWGRLNVKATDEFTKVQYPWAEVAGSISISGTEDIQNSGIPAQFNLLKAKIINLENAMKEFLNTMILQASTAAEATDFLGLDSLVENVAGASQGTLGGIDRSAHAFWRNQVETGVAVSSLTSTLRSFINTCSKGITRPDLILTTQALYETYEDQNAGKQIIQDTRLLDVGFENLRIRGITMMWDELMQTGLMYVLNSSFINITLHSRRNFVMSEFKTPIDQVGKIAQLLLAGNMTLNNSRFQGVLDFN